MLSLSKGIMFDQWIKTDSEDARSYRLVVMGRSVTIVEDLS